MIYAGLSCMFGFMQDSNLTDPKPNHNLNNSKP